MEEFNRVLGGGGYQEVSVLIGWGSWDWGNQPFSHKSPTQLSQVGTVLYVSGEESAQQIKLRAERLGDIDSEFYLMQRPICRVFELRWSASSQTSSSSTPFRLLCLLRFQGAGSVSQVRRGDSGTYAAGQNK